MKKVLAATAATALTLGAIAAPTVFAATKNVRVGDNFFSVKSLTVTKGSSVKWTWKGTSAPHSVTRSAGPAFKASKTQTGGSFTHKFTTKGTYKLFCSVHPTQMKITVKVK